MGNTIAHTSTHETQKHASPAKRGEKMSAHLNFSHKNQFLSILQLSHCFCQLGRPRREEALLLLLLLSIGGRGDGWVRVERGGGRLEGLLLFSAAGHDLLHCFLFSISEKHSPWSVHPRTSNRLLVRCIVTSPTPQSLAPTKPRCCDCLISIGGTAVC